MPAPDLKQQIAVTLQNKDFVAAVCLLRQAFAHDPQCADTAYNYGVALYETGQNRDALQAWRRATRLDPACLPAWQNAGLMLALQGATKDALALYQTALRYHPSDKKLLFAYANLCCEENRLDQACSLFDRLTQDYAKDADIWINAGKTYKAAALYDKAESCYRHALALRDPARLAQAAFNYASLLLLQQRWREGFTAYEARLNLPGAMPAPWGLPAWRPDLPQGSRVLAWNDQGLGDAVMFARFVPDLIAQGYHVSLFVQEPLKSLLSSIDGIEKIFDPLDEPQKFDAALPLASLPFALDIQPRQFWSAPYLAPPPDAPRWQGESGRKKIGIVWAGNAAHVNDKNRSMKLDDFAPLFDLPGIEWLSLQKEKRTTGAARQPGLRDMSPFLTDLAATAALICELDLVICVDTAIAHLAGALGKTAWVLLPFVNSDWRWGISGATSLWYPTLRLFRQTKPGDWGKVIADIGMQLATQGHQ